MTFLRAALFPLLLMLAAVSYGQQISKISKARPHSAIRVAIPQKLTR